LRCPYQAIVMKILEQIRSRTVLMEWLSYHGVSVHRGVRRRALRTSSVVSDTKTFSTVLDGFESAQGVCYG
jgi:hypothetical protein